MSSGNAKDLLAGGAGKDTLKGGGGDDLLVADRSSYDAGTDDDVRAWTGIMREWVGGSTLALKQSRILGPVAGGLNGSYVLKTTGVAATLFSDGQIDILDGGTGKNWVLAI